MICGFLQNKDCLSPNAFLNRAKGTPLQSDWRESVLESEFEAKPWLFWQVLLRGLQGHSKAASEMKTLRSA